MTNQLTTTDPLVSIATELLGDHFDPTAEPTPTLFVFDGGHAAHPLVLDDVDAVRSLRGRVAPPATTAVAFMAGARVTPTVGTQPSTDGLVVHVVDRTGRSVTVVRGEHGDRTFGPTSAPQTGRVPDSCRRMLGLPTTPPTAPMLEFVVASWLEVVTRHVLADPSLTWSAAVALHPAASSLPPDPSVAAVADATVELGASLDWERFRRVIATIGGFPFDDDATATAEWMDVGMFSRWALDKLADPDSLLELLGDAATPALSERIWAAIRLLDDHRRTT